MRYALSHSSEWTPFGARPVAERWPESEVGRMVWVFDGFSAAGIAAAWSADCNMKSTVKEQSVRTEDRKEKGKGTC